MPIKHVFLPKFAYFLSTLKQQKLRIFGVFGVFLGYSQICKTSKKQAVPSN
jgi:hypothetical protein